MKLWLLSVAIALSACSNIERGSPPLHRPDAKTVQLLESVRGEMHAAMIRGDRAKLEQLLDESFVFVHSTGKLESRSAFIDRMVQASVSQKVPTIDFVDNDIRLYGNTAVWVTHSVRRGTPMTFVGTDVLIRTETGWKWVSVQSTRTDD
jgi:hypothetical protein